MNKYFVVVSFFVLGFLIAFFSYLNIEREYHVLNTNESIEEAIATSIYPGAQIKVDVFNKQKFPNSSLMLAGYKDSTGAIGYVTLKKGLNNEYKISHNNVRKSRNGEPIQEVLTVEKENFLVLTLGENKYDVRKVTSSIIKIDENRTKLGEFTINIPENQMLVVKPLKKLKIKNWATSTTYYDSKGKEIKFVQ